MAYTFQQLARERVRPLHGRNAALDANNFIVGPKGLREPIEDEQTTAATSFANFGMTRILTTGSSQTGVYTLQVPAAGVRKEIVLVSSSTGCMIIRASGGALFYGASVSTAGSTCINLLGKGASVVLRAVSTLAWQMLNSYSSLVSSDHQNYSFTTST